MGIMISISQASVLVNLPFDIADEGIYQVFSSFCQYYVFWPGSYREKRRNFFFISLTNQLAQFSQSYKAPQWSGVELVCRRPQSRQARWVRKKGKPVAEKRNVQS